MSRLTSKLIIGHEYKVIRGANGEKKRTDTYRLLHPNTCRKFFLFSMKRLNFIVLLYQWHRIYYKQTYKWQIYVE